MPRDWPPVSVWLLVLLLLTPEAALLAAGIGSGHGDTLGAGVVVLVVMSPALVCLVLGEDTGLILLDVGLSLLGLVVLLTLAAAVVAGEAGDIEWGDAAGLLVPVTWGAVVFGLRRWPETRRWCGVLSPVEPEE